MSHCDLFVVVAKIGSGFPVKLSRFENLCFEFLHQTKQIISHYLKCRNTMEMLPATNTELFTQDFIDGTDLLPIYRNRITINKVLQNI